MADNLGFGASWTGGNPFLGQGNPYLQQNIDATLGDITRNYNTMVKPQTESAMVGSGSFGNSGLQQMQGEQQRNLAQQLGNTAGNMRMQDYNQQQNMYQWDQGFNRNLFNDATAQNNQAFNNYLNYNQTLGNLNTQDINNAATIHNMPLQYQTQFANLATGFGGMGGSGTSNTPMPGNAAVGALGGWQLGNDPKFRSSLGF